MRHGPHFVPAAVLAGLCGGLLQVQAAQDASKPAGAAATRPADDMNSFQGIQRHFDEQLEQSRRKIESQRLAALEAFLAKAPAGEREAVLGAMVELAVGLEQHDRAIALSEQYLKNFPASPDLGTIRKLRISAFIDANRLDQARKELEDMLTGLKPGQTAAEQIRDALWLGVLVAEAHADAGDVKGAREAFGTLKQKLPQAAPENEREMFLRQLEQQVLEPRLEQLNWIGKEPPGIEGQDLAGNPVDLSKYKGKVVLLDFWATWCAPCIASLPALREAYQKYHDRGFEIIGISLDADGEAMKSFLQRQKIPWPQVWDNQAMPGTQNPFGGPNTRKYNLTAVPATFLIDRDGKIARAGVNARALEELVGRVLTRPATRP